MRTLAKTGQSAGAGFPCDYCGRGQIRRVVKPRLFFPDPRGGKLVALEDVPIGECDCCGEDHYSAVLLRQVEILRLKRSPSRTVSIPVARYIPPR